MGKRTEDDYQRFIAVYTDTKRFPSLDDVAAELQLRPRTIREIRRELELDGHAFPDRPIRKPYLTDQPLPKSPNELIQEFYARKIEDVLGSALPTDIDGPVYPTYTPVVCIPDIHAPFTDENCVTIAVSVIKRLYAKYGKQLVVVILGDIYDLYSFADSKLPKSQVIFTPDAELFMGRAVAQSIIERLMAAAPGCTFYLLRGNHDMRPHKQVIKAGTGLEALEDYDGLWQFDGVNTIMDPRDDLIIDDINYHHGTVASASGNHFGMLGRSNVHGHTHRGGLMHRKIDGKWMWELDCGYWGHWEAKCFTYMPKRPIKWSRGMGLVLPSGPVWMPFE